MRSDAHRPPIGRPKGRPLSRLYLPPSKEQCYHSKVVSRRNSPPLRGWRTSLWTHLLGLLLCLGAPMGVAARPPLPTVPPGNYIMEAQGDVHWVYPESTLPEVRELQHLVPAALVKLQHAFGVEISSVLDIRVALHAEEMAALSPGHDVPRYAQGVAYPSEGLILLTFAAPFSFDRPDMAQVLIHELSHVALQRAVGDRPLPRWFTEGVAIHEAGERSLSRLRVLWEGTLRKQLLPLEELSNSFPQRADDVNVAYAQSADMVAHLLDGKDDQVRFQRLLQLLRQGQEFSLAIEQAYGVSLHYIEREWRNSLLRSYGRFPSMLTGLSAIWGVTAILLFFGYLRARRRHHKTLERWQREEATQQTPAVEPSLLVATSAPPTATSEAPHRLDAVMDRVQLRASSQPDVPTVEHDGESHTLH